MVGKIQKATEALYIMMSDNMNKYLKYSVIMIVFMSSCGKSRKVENTSDVKKKIVSAYNLKDAFNNKETIQYLTLENNDIIPDSIILLNNLEDLELRNYNSLENINSNIYELPNLKSLSIIHSNLSSIHSEIKKAVKLKELTLHSSDFKNIPDVTFKLEYLEDLNMVNNHLTSIPSKLKSLKRLKWLDVSGNDFSKKDIEKYKKEYTYLNFQCVDRETMD